MTSSIIYAHSARLLGGSFDEQVLRAYLVPFTDRQSYDTSKSDY